MSILYSKSLREYKNATFKTRDRVRLSRKGYKPQSTAEVFGIVALATKKPPTYTIKNEQGEII